MIENYLTAALRELVAEAVKDFSLPTKSGEHRSPKIINGYLPPKRSGPDNDFPFVVVRPEHGASEQEVTSVTVALIIGCFSEEFDGYECCIEIMTRIRHALTAMENRTLARKYQLQLPITWENVPDQPYPQWQIEMETTWTVRTPQPVENEEVI